MRSWIQEMVKGMNFSNWDWLKLPRLSPWIVISMFMFAAVISVSISRSFLDGEIWNGNQQFQVANRDVLKGPDKPPVFAYWISGTGGENEKILRLLRAVYHPRNRYLIQLDAGATIIDRAKLARAIQSENVFRVFRNVDVIGKSYVVDRRGPSLVAATLHGAAILLKLYADWDWFITLSSSDYPLVTQDDLLDAFASIPRDLNFIDHTSDLGWKEIERFDKMVVDPNLYMNEYAPFFYAPEKRKTPDAFKIFTGSPWVILSRPFVDFCVQSWDNLPRKLLMYFANVAYTMESYFQTVICNAPEFQNTTINHDLRFVLWDNPPKLESLALNVTHYKTMVKSGAAFARWFAENETVLRKVDRKILKRPLNGILPGKWCAGMNNRKSKDQSLCSSWSDINTVKPTGSGKPLRKLVSKLVSDLNMNLNQCR